MAPPEKASGFGDCLAHGTDDQTDSFAFFNAASAAHRSSVTAPASDFTDSETKHQLESQLSRAQIFSGNRERERERARASGREAGGKTLHRNCLKLLGGCSSNIIWSLPGLRANAPSVPDVFTLNPKSYTSLNKTPHFLP